MVRRRSERVARAGAVKYCILTVAIALIAAFLFAQFGAFVHVNVNPEYVPSEHRVCSIYRPGGPGTTSNLSFIGNCSDDLWFESAASASINHIGTVTIGNQVLSKVGSFTVTEWTFIEPQGSNVNILASLLNETIYSYSTPGVRGYELASGYPPYNLTIDYLPFYHQSILVGWRSRSGTTYIHSEGCNMTGATFVVISYNESDRYLKVWRNGEECGSVILKGVGNLSSGLSLYANYEIANLQLYNTSLPEAEIMDIYRNGIYATPSLSKNLMGWWPLDGNSSDHSGNNNILELNGIVYNGISVFPAN
ncbi:MAG: hypothetical protein KGH94_03565 [Candidatus Micrarchaeota archaeon]|nr:hypothetical protein [Candidatus Micrarchaeota archaeon]